jgi:uncharacterized protein YggU (UPF0235/DUF167 family)
MFSHRVTAPAAEKPGSSARIRMWVRPGSSAEDVRWDPWRGRWAVAVRERAVRGDANRAVLSFLAERLGVAPDALRWVHAGRTAAKEAEVVGLDDAQVERRLGGGAEGAVRRPVGKRSG